MDYTLDQKEVEYMGKLHYAYGTVCLNYSEQGAESDVGIFEGYREVESIEPYNDCYLVNPETEQEITIPKADFAKLLDTTDNEFFEAVNDD